MPSSYFWAEREPARTIMEGTPEFSALATLEYSAAALMDAPADLTRVNSYFTAQRQFRRLLGDRQARKGVRELPQSPPYREFVDPNVLHRAEATKVIPIAHPAKGTRLMSYPVVNRMNTWMLHHAAPFAAVRWTNVFDPAILVFFGDVIGGPLAPVFGPAIFDIDLRALHGGRQSWAFTHTKYWALGEPTRIAACREAVNLLDREI